MTVVLIIAAWFLVFYVLIKFSPLFGGIYQVNKKLENSPQSKAFVGWYKGNLIKSPLFISQDRIWYEYRGKVQYEFTINELEKITYSSRRVQFTLKDGSQYYIDYLISSKANFLSLLAAYDNLWSDPGSLEELVDIVKSLGIDTVEDRQLKKDYSEDAGRLFKHVSIVVLVVAAIFGAVELIKSLV